MFRLASFVSFAMVLAAKKKQLSGQSISSALYNHYPMKMETEKEIKKNPMFLYLAVLTVSSTVGLQAWLTLFNNFAVEIAGLDGNHIGMIQSLREVPGFLALLAVYVIMILKEHRRKRGSHVPFHVVGEHAYKNMALYPL